MYFAIEIEELQGGHFKVICDRAKLFEGKQYFICNNFTEVQKKIKYFWDHKHNKK